MNYQYKIYSLDWAFNHSRNGKQNNRFIMKESEIRPKEIFEEFLRLAKIDTKTYFENSLRVKIHCPACNSRGQHAFTKNNFDYCECKKCHTLYVNPRPNLESFTNYYTSSPSTKYWATTFYKETADARREKIWKPKAQIIADVLKEKAIDEYQVIDIGGGYGIFAEEMQKYSVHPVIIIEPAPHLAEISREKGFEVIEKFLEDVSVDDLPTNLKCFVSFELFEHLHSPENFLLNLNILMQPNDLFIFTTLSGTGLDIQVLWENSPSVSPPHHLNFFNPYSVQMILERTGFQVIKVNTPGKLDIDILVNNKDYVIDKFWNTFIETTDEDCKQKWQSLITESGWSSHMMVVSRKV